MNNLIVERTQTGVRLEKSLLDSPDGTRRVLRDLSLGDLLEGIVLHRPVDIAAFESGSFDLAAFDQAAHVRIAWAGAAGRRKI
jgi:hypothetical protein